MDVQDVWVTGHCAVLEVIIGSSGQRDDGMDPVAALAGHAMGHEAAVGMANQHDLVRIRTVLLNRFIDEAGQPLDIVRSFGIEVAAGLGRIPVS